jgi:hypothetical protein
MLHAACRAGLVAALALGATSAWGNIRAPIIDPQPPSSAAHALGGPNDQLSILDEALTFRCTDSLCEVEARYRVRAPAALTVELAFVSPQATPLSVRVGSTAAVVDVSTSVPEPVHEDEIGAETTVLHERHLAAVQARFVAAFVPGENVVTVSYRQPLGRREYGHGYLRKGRFVKFFRYELWPLREWKHEVGFHVDGDVAIRRPPPSWWQRIFSTPRSVGCVGSESLRNVALLQSGDDLHLTFHLTDPIPRRLWCELGDEDLVPRVQP